MKSLMDLIAQEESGGNYEAMYPNTTLPGATEMTISQVAQRATGPVGRYQHKPQFLEERARAVGLDPNKDKFSPENQDKITRGHITGVLGGDETKVVEQLKKDPLAIKKRLEDSQYTGLQKFNDSDFNVKFRERERKYEPQANARRSNEPIARVPNTTPNMVALTLPSPSQNSKSPMSMADSGGSNISNVGTGIDYTFASRSGVGIFNA
jgi:hypothetical protein